MGFARVIIKGQWGKCNGPWWKSAVGSESSCLPMPPFRVNPTAWAGFTPCDASIFFFFFMTRANCKAEL